MKRSLLAALTAAIVLTGCQPDVVSKYMPVAVPIRLSPATTLTVVGTGNTAEEARQAAIDRLVSEVILPPSEPRKEQPAEFVGGMIRGYNVASSQKDIMGKYYVAVELSVSQLGLNYQELYHRCKVGDKEAVILRREADNEHQLRELAEHRAATAVRQLEAEQKLFTKRLMDLQTELEALKSKQEKQPDQ